MQYIYTNPNFPKNIEKSLKEAFIQADKDYLKNFLLMKDTNINMNDPQGIVQYLLNNGMVNQDQVNRAMQMRDDPSIKQYLGIR